VTALSPDSPPEPVARARVLRILMVCRSYSGLDAERWNPSGTPAMIRLIEGLERAGHRTSVLFLEKAPRGTSGPRAPEGRTTDFGVFRNTLFTFLPWRGLARGPAALSAFVNEALQFPAAWRATRAGYDLIYVDRGHLAYAALLSLGRVPVVWRCLGVMPFVIARHSGNPLGRLYYRLSKQLLRFPIARVICSDEGSPWYRLFDRPGPRAKLALMRNGVDGIGHAPSDRDALRHRLGLPGDVPVIAFIGRMVESKNVMEFARAIGALRDRGIACHAILVGYGPLLDPLRAFVRESDLGDRVTVVGRVPLDEIPDILGASDLFVTLSDGGALGNTTLEAMAAGLGLVALESDPVRGIDVTTDEAVPADVMIRVPRHDLVAALAGTLALLLVDTARLAALKARTRDFARSFLVSWEERIAKEIALLERLVPRQSELEGSTAE
jgi:glycosyltransferase involved in cell wall biosynthesis